MRLKSKSKNNNKKKTIIIVAVIVVLLVLVLVAGGMFVYYSSQKPEEMEPQDIIGIELSSTSSKTVYYVGESFDPTGTRVQVMTFDFDKSYFVDHTQLRFSGFDSSTVGEKTITVTYKDYSTSFRITVKEYETAAPTLTSIRMSDDFKFTYTISDWNEYGPKVNTAKLVLIYSDGSEKEVGMKRGYCSNINDVTSAGTTEFTVTYEEAGIVVSTTVTVTITN